MAEVTAKQEKAIRALLASPTITHAAQNTGCGERTLRRWLRDPDFVERYREVRAQLVGQSIGLLASGLATAALVLRQVLTSDTASASARVASARAMFELTLRYTEIAELETRIAELERAMQVQELTDGAPEL